MNFTEHQLAQPGHSTLLCYAHLWSSAKHGLSCMILHVVEHVTLVTQLLPALAVLEVPGTLQQLLTIKASK